MMQTKLIYAGVKKWFVPNTFSLLQYISHKVILRCGVLISASYRDILSISLIKPLHDWIQ